MGSVRLRYGGLVAATVAAPGLDDPPRFLQLVAHPVRWRLLRELAHSDRAVHELTELVDERQNLVSYHLRQLGSAGVVRSRHSSADRRDRYYAIDLMRCGELLQVSGASLHPALRLAPPPPEARRISNHSRRRPRVLFLCTGNSARSQMAEALLARMSDGAVEAASAGSDPKPLHRNAVRVMRKRGIDISGNRSKHLRELSSQRFDVVITLCDRVREVCPEFPSHPDLVHWSVPDPALAGPDDRATYGVFEGIAAELETRLWFLLARLDEVPTRRSTHDRH
jgi:protein-tyrosine-phosphatase/DNA-binding transcriptional ArsR family regulator